MENKCSVADRMLFSENMSRKWGRTDIRFTPCPNVTENCPVLTFLFTFFFSLKPSTMRPPTTLAALLRARPAVRRVAPAFARPSSSAPHQETFESFTERYVQFFQQAQDLFELQRGLNNCFSHDLVPAPSVIEAALRAARRVDDYATAVRVFEGVREKVENKQQYQAYLDELKGVREELGMLL